MGFVEATQECLRKYVKFDGRAGRSEYWWFALFTVLVSLVAGFFGDVVSGLVSLALLLPSLAVGARRLHDIGKSGWFLLVWAVPLVGWALMVYWAVQPSGPPNAFGAGPERPREDLLGIPPGV